MIVALYILLAIVAVGVVLKLTDRRPAEGPDVVEPEQECCGMHVTCERDSLLVAVAPDTDKPEYFDDEELDSFAGRDAGDYSAGEIEMFRDVLLTLLPEDIAPWARSVQMRGITLPSEIREELLMIVSEARASRTA